MVGLNNQSQDYPITINVTNAPTPPTINFWVDNGTINAGQCTTLHWDVQNVREVYLNDQGVAGQGSQQVCPGSTTTYTLRVVRNDGGQETRQVTVNVSGCAATWPVHQLVLPQSERNPGRAMRDLQLGHQQYEPHQHGSWRHGGLLQRTGQRLL